VGILLTFNQKGIENIALTVDLPYFFSENFKNLLQIY